MSAGEKDSRNEDFTPQDSSGLHALQAAYNERAVTLPMLVVGAAIVAALVGLLVALVIFGGASV